MIYTLEDYKEFIPLTTINTATYYQSAEKRALRKLKPYVGPAIIAAIKAGNEELKTEAAMAIVNLAFLEGLPFLNVVSTSTGFGIVNTGNMAPASVQRTDALKKSLYDAFLSGLDSLLDYLEENQDGWNQSTLLPGLVKNSTQASELLQEYISRPTFFTLRSKITEFEDNIISKISQQQFDEFTYVTPLIADNANYLVVNDTTTLKVYNDSKAKKLLIRATLYFAQGNTERSNLLINQAFSLLVNNPGTYPLFHEFAYEAPYENDLDDEDNGTFVTA